MAQGYISLVCGKQVQPARHSGEHLLGRKHPDPRSRELDSQRNSVKHRNERGYLSVISLCNGEVRSTGLSSVEKQANTRIIQNFCQTGFEPRSGQRPKSNLVFAVYPKVHSRGRYTTCPRHGTQQSLYRAAHTGLNEMLEVVQNEKNRLSFADLTMSAFTARSTLSWPPTGMPSLLGGWF